MENEPVATTDSPIIGILSQETYSVHKYFPDKQYKSYIAASYVKFVESAGARVVPLWIGQDEGYYEKAVKYTNGILLPGGATYFDEPEGYGDAVSKIYKLAVDQNENGTHFPILGVCLGMEALVYVSNGNADIRVECDSKKIASPLVFDDDFSSSKLFRKAPGQILEILQKKNVTYNYHQKCLTDREINEANLGKIWRVLSRNKDKSGMEFISTMEHYERPFYGLQFHPEKNRFEFKQDWNIPHGIYGNVISQYFAEFFVEEARKNGNKFPNGSLEFDSLIYNFDPVFTGRSSPYLQLYMFDQDDFAEHQF